MKRRLFSALLSAVILFAPAGHFAVRAETPEQVKETDNEKIDPANTQMTFDASSESGVSVALAFPGASEMEDDALPAGTEVGVSVAVSGENQSGVDTISLYEISENDERLIGSLSGAGGGLLVELASEARLLKAVACDSAGSVLAISDTVSLPKGYSITEKSFLYDIDFESETITSELSSAHYASATIADAAGVAISPKRYPDKTAWGPVGEAANSISIDDTADSVIPGGTRALHLQRGARTAVNFNQIEAPISGGIAVISMDYYSNMQVNTTALGVNDGGNWPHVTFKGSAKEITFNGKSYKMGETPAWYRIVQILDIDNKNISCLINGEYMGTANYDKATGTLVRILSQTSWVSEADTEKAKGDVWIDNLQVYEAERSAEVLNAEAQGNEIMLSLSKVMEEDDLASVSVGYGKNELYIEKYSVTDNAMRIQTLQPVFTQVPIEIKIDYLARGMKNELLHTLTPLAAASFDVIEVERLGEGNRVGARATLSNSTGEDKTAVMILCTRDDKGNVLSVRVTEETPISASGTELTLTAEETGGAASAEVFFIDSFSGCIPIKQVRYSLMD